MMYTLLIKMRLDIERYGIIMRKSTKSSVLFFTPFATCFILFWVVPFIYGLYMSVHNISLTKGNKGFVGLDNFVSLFSKSSMYSMEFFTGLKNTLLFVVISVPLLVAIALILALIVDNLPDKLKGIFRTIYFLSYAISVTAVSAIFLWLFNGNGGFINSLLVKMHLIEKPISWLESQPFAWIVIVIVTIWWTVGYNMILFINGLNNIDGALYEASSVDGANFWIKFRYIILPGLKNVTTYVVLMSIIASFNLYGQSNLITRGGPAQSTKSMIMVIYDTILQKNNLGVGSAMALVMGVIVMLFAICQQFLSKEKEEIKEVNGK